MFSEWENSSGNYKSSAANFKNSGKFQNDAINDVKEISLSHVIKKEIYCKIAIWKTIEYKTNEQSTKNCKISTCSFCIYSFVLSLHQIISSKLDTTNK